MGVNKGEKSGGDFATPLRQLKRQQENQQRVVMEGEAGEPQGVVSLASVPASSEVSEPKHEHVSISFCS